MKKLILIPILLTLYSCATFYSPPNGQVLVQYATIKFIKNDDRPLLRAQKVILIATRARTYFDRNTLPLDQIEVLIRRKINWSQLNSTDTLLVNALIARVREEVHASGLQLETEQASGSTILTWIINGAQSIEG